MKLKVSVLFTITLIHMQYVFRYELEIILLRIPLCENEGCTNKRAIEITKRTLNDFIPTKKTLFNSRKSRQKKILALFLLPRMVYTHQRFEAYYLFGFVCVKRNYRNNAEIETD